MPKPDAEGNGAKGRDASEDRQEQPHEGQALPQDQEGRKGQGQEQGEEQEEVESGMLAVAAAT